MCTRCRSDRGARSARDRAREHGTVRRCAGCRSDHHIDKDTRADRMESAPHVHVVARGAVAGVAARVTMPLGVRWPQPPLSYVLRALSHTKAVAVATALQTTSQS